MSIFDAAKSYHNVGLCILPANPATKAPAVAAWGRYRSQPPTWDDVQAWFRGDAARGICIVCGAASGRVEAIDFDLRGEMFEPWAALVEQFAPGVLGQCLIEQTPSGGRHVFYRLVDGQTVPGNRKLATRIVPVDAAGQHEYHGKNYAARQNGNQFFLQITTIETRGEGGIILVAPTPGYQIVSGRFENLPVLSSEHARILISAAKSLDDAGTHAQDGHGGAVAPSGGAQIGAGHNRRPDGIALAGTPPGQDFSQRGDPRPHLLAAGWVLVKPGTNEYWRRPGKDQDVSATLKNQVFWVFSSNAAPFKHDTGYGPFAVFALLEHGGNYSAAAGALRRAGYGGEIVVAESPELAAIDLSGLECGGKTTAPVVENSTEKPPDLPLDVPVEIVDREPEELDTEDPGIMPDDLLNVPGLMNEMQDYCLENAPQPNQIQAFAGALAFQAFLGGRKVADPLNNRTNLYILGLAHSASGKDFPRQLNYRLAEAAGFTGGEVAGRFVSGEGIEDALLVTPNMLFQVDEIDGMLASIGRQRKDGRPDTMMGTLLAVNTSAGGLYPMRRKAAGENSTNGMGINQPCLTIYGTAIPNHYFEAVSERMMTNGFFSRCIVLESGQRHPGRDIDRIHAVPQRMIQIASWWRNFNPGGGNLSSQNPHPRTVEYTPEARELMSHTRRLASDECTEGERKSDTIITAVWGRVHEHARKLALVYACSENFENPMIGERAAEWGTRVATYQVNKALHSAKKHVADSEFEGHALKFMRYLFEAGNRAAHGLMLKKMRMASKDFSEIVTTLESRGDIRKETVSTTGRAGLFYHKT